MPTTSDLLVVINQRHATAFVLLNRYATGEQAAFALSDAAATTSCSNRKGCSA